MKGFEAFGSPEDKVIEECSEVIKAICKGKRFGWKNYHPDRPMVSNANDVLAEFDDLRRVMNELEPILLILDRQFIEEHGGQRDGD
jgi:hypothetical protein